MVAAADELEEELGSHAVQREVTHLVHKKKLGLHSVRKRWPRRSSLASLCSTSMRSIIVRK